MNYKGLISHSFALLSAATLSAASFGQGSEPFSMHWKVTFNGSPAGECSYSLDAAGNVKASSHLSIATTDLTESLTGKFEKSRLVAFEVASTRNGKPAATLSVSGNKFKVKRPGQKDVEAPYNYKDKVYTGNLIPQFTATALQAVDFDKKSAQTVMAFIPEGGSVIPLHILPLTTKSAANGTVKLFRATIGVTSVEYALTTDGHVVGMDVPGQKLRMVADGWDAIYVDPFSKYPELSQPTYGVKKLPTQHLKTRDGADLVQDVFLPDAPGKYPTVFIRTPYDRNNDAANADFYVKRGYAYVVQDCRGRTDSGGEWDPFVHESEDGYDSIDWISHQPWSDGSVGMIGASYEGYVQWAAAVSFHPALKCIIPQVSPPMDAMHNLPYDGGIFFLYGDVWWAKIVRNKKSDMSTVLASLPHPKGFATLPLSKVDDSVLGFDVPFFDKWLERTTLADWKGWNYADRLPKVTIPALQISGWFDGDEIGTNMNWAALRKAGRKNQWLIYGPWTHFFNSSSSLGDTDYGAKAIIDLDTLYIRWFDTWLKHKEVGIEKIPHVQAFVTGANQWMKLADWPSPYSEPETLFLQTTGSSVGLKGGGKLVPTPAKDARTNEIHFDPHKADVPDSILNVDPNKASTDVTDLFKSKDSLVYLSDPLEHPMAISGPFDVDLFFSTSARDTDFYAVMIDIDAKGHARSFGSGGKLRMSYLKGFDKVRPLVSGKIYEAHIGLWDAAHELKAGHRLALVVSCSGFPMFARNLGTAEPIKNATRMLKQDNRIYMDSYHRSSLKFRVLWK